MEITVPECLMHPLFFSGRKQQIDPGADSLANRGFFPYELIYASVPQNAETPWQDGKRYIPQYLEYWKGVKSMLEGQFRQREKHTKTGMLEGIAVFISILFWSNRKPVVLKGLDKELGRLETVPVNIGERLCFILNRPGSYPSFCQLSELIDEQHKHWAGKQAKVKWQK